MCSHITLANSLKGESSGMAFIDARKAPLAVSVANCSYSSTLINSSSFTACAYTMYASPEDGAGKDLNLA